MIHALIKEAIDVFSLPSMTLEPQPHPPIDPTNLPSISLMCSSLLFITLYYSNYFIFRINVYISLQPDGTF